MVKKNDSTNLMELLCGVWEKGTRKEQWEQGKSLSKRHRSLYAMGAGYICSPSGHGLVHGFQRQGHAISREARRKRPLSPNLSGFRVDNPVPPRYHGDSAGGAARYLV